MKKYFRSPMMPILLLCLFALMGFVLRTWQFDYTTFGYDQARDALVARILC